MAQNKERLAWVNGEFVPESRAVVSIRDAGLVYGDSVFDTARTFNGKLFRLKEHMDRLYRSLEKTLIDPGMTAEEMAAVTEELVQLNLPVLRPGEDYWVTQRVTTGQQKLDGETPVRSGATVAIDCIPVPLRARARLFKDGINAVVAERRRISEDALSANIKSNNYLNMMLAQREVGLHQPGAWALMCDRNGNIAEGAGCNFFIVENGRVITPKAKFVLEGISRQVVMEICERESIELEEADFDSDRAEAADEGFFTSTSLCICPVGRLNGRTFDQVPGPVTARITEAFKAEVDFDFVQQYLDFLSDDNAGSTGL